MKVKIIAHTPEPEKVVASAAKLCYSPVGVDEIQENLTPEKIEEFVNGLASMGHESPVEHVSFTFAIEGVSRSLTHQLVRHRLASYSQQSQRYVRLDQFEYIIPPAIEKNETAKKIFLETMNHSQETYDKLVVHLIGDLAYENQPADYGRCIRMIAEEQGATAVNEENILEYFKEEFPKDYIKYEKRAIEDARYVFPNACETKIVVTMNVRTLLHFFSVRCCNRAQWEIRDLADEMLKQCKEVAPILFSKAGAPCTYGKCTEGPMSCGKPRK